VNKEVNINMSPIKLLVVCISITLAPHAVSQKNLDIVQIMEQFVQASYAASRCIKPDEKMLSDFLLNFKMVTVRAAEELQKRNPGKSEQQVLQSMKRDTSAVEEAIDGAMRENGCNDPRIQNLLKRFEMQANLSF
jgi:hypothetical protein